MSCYSNIGFVWKNDVYAHGARVNKEGMVIKPKKCMECNEAIDATETCIYVFAARGTSAAQSRYVHAACESKCHIEPISRKGSVCRVCQKSGNLDGCFRLPGRNIYYHQSCLPNARREVVPEEQIKEKMKKRAEGRLKRGEVHYEVKINPYTGLELSRIQEAGYHYDRTNHVEITLKPLDGKLVQATWGWGVNLFRSGGWGKQEDIKYNLDTTPLRDKEHRPDLETLLKVQEDLKKHFDQRGRVIGERLDADYKLRFVLNYGTSIEGAVNEPTR